MTSVVRRLIAFCCPDRTIRPGRIRRLALLAVCCLMASAGCYTPLHSPATHVSCLPYEYRMPERSIAPQLNLAKLTVEPPVDYILGANDTLEITIPDLFEGSEVRPITARIMANGALTLPLVGKVQVAGKNLSEAQDAVNEAFADGFIVNPRVSVALAQPNTIDVSVIGMVNTPGVYNLPRYQNDVSHALALAGGLQEFAAEVVEVHRRVSTAEFMARFGPNGTEHRGMSSPNGVEELFTPPSPSPSDLESEVPYEEPIEQPVPPKADPADEETSENAAEAPAVVEFTPEGIPYLFGAGAGSDVPADSPTEIPALLPVPKEKQATPAVFKSDKASGGMTLQAVNAQLPAPTAEPVAGEDDAMEVMLRIPLRGGVATVNWDGGQAILENLTAADVTLERGDVVVIPRKPDEIFFVVGPLNRTNVVNFTVRERDRELGNAFLIPPDRDIDVVTAVAMAGYIDPIESPDTVTVHRQRLGETPMLIHVDLMAARYDWNQNMYVQPGDILYLNPDPAWWFRRTFDRIVPVIITQPYVEAMRFWIPGGNGNN